MAKRTPAALTTLSITDLNRELSRRRRALPALQRRLAATLAKADRLRAQIAALGGEGGAGKSGGRTGGVRNASGHVAAGGVRNDGRLVDYLRRALSGRTMGVNEAAEAVKAAGYQSDSPNFRLIVNACLLNKKHGFKRISRGQYTAG